MTVETYQVVHALPGRVRLRISRLASDSRFAHSLEQQLVGLPLVSQVRINAAASCLVIDYNPLLSLDAIAAELTQLLQLAKRQQQDGTKTLEAPSLTAATVYDLPWNTDLLLERVSLPALTLAIALVLPAEMPLLSLLMVGLIFSASWPTFQHAIASLQHRHPEASLLESLWTILHTLEGQYVAPSLAATMVESSGALRDMTARAGEQQKLQLLSSSRQYWVERQGKKQQLLVSELQPGDQVTVSTGSAIPVDGRVIRGTGLLDLHSLTGESDLVTCGEGESVYATSLVVKGQLFIVAEQTGQQTRAGQALQLMEAAPIHDTRIGNYAEEVANQAILPSMGLAALVFAFTLDSHRAIAALQLDFGAGIGLSVPTTILSALTAAARNGVYIRSGRALEILAKMDTIVFDKTGTLTQARGKIVGIETVHSEIQQRELLSLAASAEQYLTHPIAEAIVHYAQSQGVKVRECETWDYQVGMGVRATIQGQELLVGNSRWLQEQGINPDLSYIRNREGVLRNRSLVYIACNGEFLGVIFYSNAIRPEATSVVQHLEEQGISSHLLTGDNHRVASAVAYKLGMSLGNIYTDALPDRKVEVLQKLHKQGRTIAYVGDGINDIAALAYADVSISMAGGSDIARHRADVILLDDDLRGLLYAIQVAKQAMQLIEQNIALVVIPNVSVVLAGIFFSLNPVAAVVISNGAMLLAELNALRPLLESDRQDPELDPDSGRSEEGLLSIPWQKRPRGLLQDLPLA